MIKNNCKKLYNCVSTNFTKILTFLISDKIKKLFSFFSLFFLDNSFDQKQQIKIKDTFYPFRLFSICSVFHLSPMWCQNLKELALGA